ncbi:MAG: hypothetical protein PHF00_04145 [Elusimicrobia bacterium]|nr:hypothetical protein [Elusimicrobiota bacterium]
MKPRVDSIELADADPAGVPGHCSAVVHVSLSDGRQFSVLAATPGWFAEAFARLGLDCYFGPLVLFVRTMDMSLVRRAVAEMVKSGDQCLCRYDTPRTTLARVLDEFKARVP